MDAARDVMWCRRWDSNPHEGCPSAVFRTKSGRPIVSNPCHFTLVERSGEQSMPGTVRFCDTGYCAKKGC